MRSWMFLIIGGGLLALAPDHAYKGGIIENNPDMGLWIVGGMVLLALLIRPTEEGWAAISSGPGCIGRLMSAVAWLSLIAFALWLLAGSPDGRGM